MQDLLEFSAGWRELVGLLQDRRSAVAIAPRYFGKWLVLEKYASENTNDPESRCLTLSSRLPTVNGDVDYASLWIQVRGQLLSKSRLKVFDCSSFLSAFNTLLAETDLYLKVFIDGAGRGHEESHYRVLSSFHRLLGPGRLSVVSTDDYSSFYYQKHNFLLSDLHSLTKVQIGPSTAEELCAFLSQAQGFRKVI